MGRGSWPSAPPPPCQCGPGAAHPGLSLVGVDVGGLRLDEAWLPWGSRPPPLRLCPWEANPHSPTNTNQTPPSWGSWCPCGGGSRGVGSVLCPEERGGGWRGQLAGLLGGAGPREERGLSELACTPCSRPALPPSPAPPPSGEPWSSPRVSPVWPRSLRMPRGKSTRPTSRHRAPPQQRLRTGPTCTSCHSPRSPCLWPSSPGVQVSEPPGGRRVWLGGQCSWGGEARGWRVPPFAGPGAL